MLTRLGPPPTSADVVDALLDCHQRIRDFTSLALRLAGAQDAPEQEVRDAAAQVHRYFSVALPLHARDEEESILPRLEGLDPDVDHELAEMMREHAEHGDPTDRVLGACLILQREPGKLPEIGPSLAAAARDLQRHFEAHLAREERVIFPAIRARLDQPTQEAIHDEMRGRRAP